MTDNNLYTFTWRIENFSKLGLWNTVTTPLFKTGNSDEEWHLHLNPFGDDLNANYLSCYLNRSAGIGELTINCTFHLIDSVGNILNFETISKTFQEYDSEGCSLISLERLKNEIKKLTADILIIRCIAVMETQHEILPINALHFNTKTKVFVNSNTFEWLVDEPEDSDFYEERVFRCADDNSFEVTLTTNPREDILIKINDASFDSKPYLNATITMYLVNDGKHVQESSSVVYVREKSKKNSWNFPTFFSSKTLREKNCIKYGSFCLIIEFITPHKMIVDTIEDNVVSQMNTIQCCDSISALHDDFGKMLTDQKHSDVTLKVEGVSISAHKCILSSRSPVFRAMFDSDSLEDQTGVVDINDLDSITLKSLLKYLYAGIIDQSTCESTLKLIIAADKYQVEKLIEKCAHTLTTLMSLENVYDVIVIADMIDSKDLKTSALNLIEKHAEEFLSSPKWQELLSKNNKLGVEILSKFALHMVKKVKYE